MKISKRTHLILTLALVAAIGAHAQDFPRRDSSLVFTPANPNLI